MKQRVCTGGNCRDGCCDRFGLKSPPETQIKDTTKAQTVEPETPPSGKATNPINLTDEADENPAPLPESYRRLEKVYGGTLHA